MSSSKQEIAKALKKTMRQLPFPVAIATAAVGKKKRGITIGSFTSLSMSPPLISFNIDRDAQMHKLISRATHFAVHIPLPEQSRLCDHFAIPGQSSEEQFEPVDHYRNGYGTPVLEQVSTVIQCRAYEQFEAGDHSIVVGEVMETEQQSTNPGVLYFDQSYHSVGEAVSELTSLDKSA